MANSGIHISSAAGNFGKDACQYSPASTAPESPIVSVGALAQNDELADFSNYGRCVSLAAPGKEILSVDFQTNENFSPRSGTSQAAPFVSGAMAVILSKNASLSPQEIKARLIRRASMISEDEISMQQIASPRILYFN